MRRTLKPLSLDSEPIPSDTLDLSFVKSHLRVSHSDDDTLIRHYTRTAIQWAEGVTHRAVIERAHVWRLTDFPYDDYLIRLPLGQTTEITSIEYVSLGETKTLTGATASPAVEGDYQEDLNGDAGAHIRPNRNATWPCVDLEAVTPVKINFRAGWTADNMPPEILNAVLMAITDAYDMRGTPDLAAVGKMLEARETLLTPWRLIRTY